MPTDSTERERRIFQECLDLPEAERTGWIRKASDGDAELEDRVLRLLAAHRRAESRTGGLMGDLRVEIEDPERIGPFRILERLGEGGMGVVYAAEQTEPVERKVALKVIKLGMDTREVIARFESERQALALMSHPNIARMLDAGATDQGRPYFVMEYVSGVPITEYCDQRRLGLDERLDLFLQVCAAVQHAHQKGVIHRDLKPSNILVHEEDGRPLPKIIDFGVAKAMNRRLTDLTMHTQLGRIIGTPEYMSPEQAEMSPLDVDTRSDIYSLGVLLYELLTGSRPFEFQGTDQGFAEIQRTIREVEPEPPSERMERLAELVPAAALTRGSTPAALTRTLRGELDWIATTALAKDRRKRYQTARELADDVERYLEDRPLKAAPPGPLYRSAKFLRRHRGALVAGVLALAALLVGAGLASLRSGRGLGSLLSGDAAGGEVVRLSLQAGAEGDLWLGSTRSIAISPDARTMAYVGQVEGETWLFLRHLDAWEPRRVRDSRGARTPFFSPDGAWVGFFAQGGLRKVPADGSSVPETVAEIGLMPRGASWSPDGRIAYSLGPAGIRAVDAAGGDPVVLSEPDARTGELEHQWPHWLPDGRALLLTVTREAGSGIVEEVAFLPVDGDARPRYLARGAQAAYLEAGYVVYTRAGGLEAAAFDRRRGELTGAGVTVLDGVRSYPAPTSVGATYFDVTPGGSLLYVPPADASPVTLDWVDGEGRLASTGRIPGVPGWPRISPDGTQAALHVGDAEGREVWILDLTRPGSIRQLTSLGGGFPVWSPDGGEIAFMSRRGGSSDIWVMPANGSREPTRVLTGEPTQIPVSWSVDGVLAYYEVAGASQRDIYTLDRRESREPGESGEPGESDEGDSGAPMPFVTSPANELAPSFSPDGRWIAYVSNETGRNEVYVRGWPPPGAVHVVSIDGGSEPVWSREGDRLYYRRENRIMEVPVEIGSGFEAGQPVPLPFETEMLDGSGGNPSYDVEPGRARFLMLRSPRDAAREPLRLVLGWDRELDRLLAGAR